METLRYKTRPGPPESPVSSSSWGLRPLAGSEPQLETPTFQGDPTRTRLARTWDPALLPRHAGHQHEPSGGSHARAPILTHAHGPTRTHIHTCTHTLSRAPLPPCLCRACPVTRRDHRGRGGERGVWARSLRRPGVARGLASPAPSPATLHPDPLLSPSLSPPALPS